MMDKKVIVILYKDGQPYQRLALQQGGLLTIGRKGSGTAVELEHSFISRKHAQLSYEETGVFIQDLGSTNRTFVNGKTLDPGTKERITEGIKVQFAKNSGFTMSIESQKFEANVEASSFGGEIGSEERSFEKDAGAGRYDSWNIGKKIHSFDEANIKQLLDSNHHLIFTRKGYGSQLTQELTNGYPNDKIDQLRFQLDRLNTHPDELSVVEIDDKGVSRFSQTLVYKRGQRYFVQDLGSTNGTFINERRLYEGDVAEIQATDRLLIIGLFQIQLGSPSVNMARQMAIKATSIRKIYVERETSFEKTQSNGTPAFAKKEGKRTLKLFKKEVKVALKPMDLEIPRGRFVALMGPSGCGKSTLLKVLNNANPATDGKVFLHGQELRANFEYLKRKIGYVPQDDIIHKELTVNDSLYYAARLRNVKPAEIDKKINSILMSLKIDQELRNKKVSKLSGGQRKRISIAVELLHDPYILFLDEPTSPLDPETIKEFLQSIRTLTEKGTTVIMVTHKPEDLQFVDEVIFLTAKGHLAYHGPADENLFAYFQIESNDLRDVYSLLSDKDEEKLKAWYTKWRREGHRVSGVPEPDRFPKPKESPLAQFFWLSLRYLRVKWSNVPNIVILLAQPLIIGALLIFTFDQLQLGTLFLMAVSAIWFGVSNAAKEIVGESAIYGRERMFNLSIFTYLGSKILVLSLIAFAQVLIFVTIVFQKYSGDAIFLHDFWSFTGFMFYLSLSATLLGLLLSAIAKNTELVMTVVPIALMPQIMLAGVINRIDSLGKEVLSYFTLGRWGTEGFANLQDGYPDFQREVRYYEIRTNTDTVPPVTDTVSVNTPDVKPFSVYNPVPKLDEKLWVDSSNGSGDLVKHTSTAMDNENLAGAVDLLGFYSDTGTSLIKLCEQTGFAGNMYMITLLNFLVLVGLFWAMKKKDNN